MKVPLQDVQILVILLIGKYGWLHPTGLVHTSFIECSFFKICMDMILTDYKALWMKLLLL